MSTKPQVNPWTGTAAGRIATVLMVIAGLAALTAAVARIVAGPDSPIIPVAGLVLLVAWPLASIAAHRAARSVSAVQPADADVAS
jgi:hypothetical protein